ncbi:hypothetical protein CFC21_012898, partial [Triticum aestivum]
CKCCRRRGGTPERRRRRRRRCRGGREGGRGGAGALPRGAEAAVGPVRGGDPRPVEEDAGVARHLRHRRRRRARLRPRRRRAARAQGQDQLRRRPPRPAPAAAAGVPPAPRPPARPFGGRLDVAHPSPWHFVYFPSRLQEFLAQPLPAHDGRRDAAPSLPSTLLELRTGPSSCPQFDLNEPPSLMFGS